MEESKELQKLYGFLQAFVYFLIVLEFVIFVHFPFPKIIATRINVILFRISHLAVYQNIIYTKLFTLFFIVLTCIGTVAKKKIEIDPVKHIFIPLLIGLVLYFGSIFFHSLNSNSTFLNVRSVDILYMICTLFGAVVINVALDNISKIIKSNFMKDRFNVENESFQQTENLIETPYSVNIPMKFYHKKKWNSGWINIVNPFRGTLLIGTPGSGKSFSVVNSYIRQLAAKGFSLVVYDYKFPDLTKIAFYNFHKAKKIGAFPKNAKFNVINFSQVEYSCRVNPLKREYIKLLSDAIETAEALVESLKKGAVNESAGGSDQFFSQSAINFLTAIIYFFSKYENGKYSDLPHVLALMNRSYEEIFTVLYSNEELGSLLAAFKSAYDKKAWEQLEGQVGTLRINMSKLASKESFWVFSEDPNKTPINLKVSDTDNPSYLIIANDPDTQSINSSLNALILNRLVRLINRTGNLPSAIIVDELPTIYFHRIANLLATARSNKVAVLLALQEIPQLRVAYGKSVADEICSICGNILSGSARNKETLEWLEKLFGRVKQVKENISIDRNRTTHSFNENMDFMIPAAKIANLQTGELVGQIAKDFTSDNQDFISTSYNCKVNLPLNIIEKEEKNYVFPPKYYTFASVDSRERILLQNYRSINSSIADIINALS